MTPFDPNVFGRFGLELIVILFCFRVIARSEAQGDKAAAWAIIGLVVESIIRNLSGG